MLKADIGNNFTHHPPPDEKTRTAYAELRQEGMNLALMIHNRAPENPETTLAIRKVEEAIFWANASIARHGVKP